MQDIAILNPVTCKPETATILRRIGSLWTVRFADNSTALLNAKTVRHMIKEAKGQTGGVK